MNSELFLRNIQALSRTNPVLASRLGSAKTAKSLYTFMESRSGERIPACSANGAFLPLHSTFDPRREGERLVSTLSGEGYLVFLGLGGAFAAEAALATSDVKKVLAVEYDDNGLAELLSGRDYTRLFLDHRFSILCDAESGALEAFIVNTYIPALDGGIRVFPLRARTGLEPRFEGAAGEVTSAIEKVSRDYSVQAYFGKRWFCNIIRNLFFAEHQSGRLPSVKKAVILAAGPALEEAYSEIQKSSGVYLIAADTALPALLHAGIEPDAVVSIDCQYLSYHHFFGTMPSKTRLFLDLASPPSLASKTQNLVFFSGGHPLSRYAARYWRALPLVDTSGGNVTYAALSLAQKLGARETVLFGADFSYPLGKTYARGTYVYPYFEKRQSRRAPIEAQHSAFLYRDSSLKKTSGTKGVWRYETDTLCFYREKVRQKEKELNRLVRYPAELSNNPDKNAQKDVSGFSSGAEQKSSAGFLLQYGAAIEKLVSFTPDGIREKELAATLLPLAAFFRRTCPELREAGLFNAVQSFCLKELYTLSRVNRS